MIRRFAAFMFLVWALGFAGFALFLPRPMDGGTSDAIVVPTGGAGRIDRGLEMLAAGKARRMLVTGVADSVLPAELAAEYDAPPALFECCIDLGREAVDTRSNALETARWVERRKVRSVRLVTTDWHMRRARFELRRALGPDIVVMTDAVRSEPGFAMLMREYNKYLLRRAAALFGI